MADREVGSAVLASRILVAEAVQATLMWDEEEVVGPAVTGRGREAEPVAVLTREVRRRAIRLQAVEPDRPAGADPARQPLAQEVRMEARDARGWRRAAPPSAPHRSRAALGPERQDRDRARTLTTPWWWVSKHALRRQFVGARLWRTQPARWRNEPTRDSPRPSLLTDDDSGGAVWGSAATRSAVVLGGASVSTV